MKRMVLPSHFMARTPPHDFVDFSPMSCVQRACSPSLPFALWAHRQEPCFPCHMHALSRATHGTVESNKTVQSNSSLASHWPYNLCPSPYRPSRLFSSPVSYHLPFFPPPLPLSGSSLSSSMETPT